MSLPAAARRTLAALFLGGLSACAPSASAERTTVHSAAGVLDPAVVAATHAHPAGATSEPLILGPPIVTVAGLPAAATVAVGADGDYYVRGARAGAAGDTVVAVHAESGAVRPAGAAGVARAIGGAAGPAVDEHGRVYTADAAGGMVRVLDPAEGTAAPRPVLMQLAAPSAVAIDSARGRLVVAERDAARLRVYELP